MTNSEPKKKVTIVLPERVIEAMRQLAKKNRRSMNSEILVALEKHLETEC